ncbi:aspartic proteinase Asp1-like [Rutidosis leptorrhynchoides]|uniref:aspartic proteinase Asp1-like n=1 Tax=Rutidosis leptorrhynchoides TaxID=125765 RepID=UPI003A9A1877
MGCVIKRLLGRRNFGVQVTVGTPPYPYYIQIDTRTDLTWIQCDAPCGRCYPSPLYPYTPTQPPELCNDPLCASVNPTNCKCPKDRCDYETVYANNQTTMGFLNKDYFSFSYDNGTLTNALLAFGCGYSQQFEYPDEPGTALYFDGFLGLGDGKVSLMNQLKEMGVTNKNVVGHCFNSSSIGRGYFYFGDELGLLTWTPYTYTENFGVQVTVGTPPYPYYIQIDTRTDLTWIQCDAPCGRCYPSPLYPYTPTQPPELCNDPLCASVNPTNCKCPKDRCDYETVYANNQTTMGFLNKDYFSFSYDNGTLTNALLAFGCRYSQQFEYPDEPGTALYFDGFLGLGDGKVSLMNQLKEMGVTNKNVVGHCFNSSSIGRGYFYFGDELGLLTWTPYTYTEKHYSVGTAEIFVGGKTIGVTSLPIVFDSGSTYSYLNSQAYGSLISLLTDYLKGKWIRINISDHTTPICWTACSRFETSLDLRNYFHPIILIFGNSRLLFQLEPGAYLIITRSGNACLGILNGTEAGVGNFNLLGSIAN